MLINPLHNRVPGTHHHLVKVRRRRGKEARKMTQQTQVCSSRLQTQHLQNEAIFL